MYKTLVALLLVAFAFSSCDKQKSSVSSTRAAKIIDANLASELQNQREKSTQEITQVDGRIHELNMVLTDLYTSECPSIGEKYAEVMAAQLEMMQSKTHYEMERSMFVDKMINLAASATSRESFKEDAQKMIEELRQQGDMYLNASRNLLQSMKNAGVENPMLDEMMAPESPDGVDPAGAEVHN